MRTLIVSDLHLGNTTGADVLRLPELRAPLLNAVHDADRVVLLGDLLELRDGSPNDAMSAARPLFEDLGRALGGRELVVIAGNHDHALVEPWLARRKDLDNAGSLESEQRLEVDSSPLLATLARWSAPAHLTASYPGIWVRDDVYATHGHYLDVHMGITSGERLMVAAIGRLRGASRGRPRSVDEYEAVIGPVYARLDAHAVLRRLAYSRVPARLGRLLAGLSHEELIGAERAAMGEVAATLGLRAGYVVFGHTHRPGPFADDDRSRWEGPLGTRLVNCGCWLHHAVPAGGRANAEAWTGPCVVVQDDEPPVAELLRSLRSATTQGPKRAQ